MPERNAPAPFPTGRRAHAGSTLPGQPAIMFPQAARCPSNAPRPIRLRSSTSGLLIGRRADRSAGHRPLRRPPRPAPSPLRRARQGCRRGQPFRRPSDDSEMPEVIDWIIVTGKARVRHNDVFLAQGEPAKAVRSTLPHRRNSGGWPVPAPEHRQLHSQGWPNFILVS